MIHTRFTIFFLCAFLGVSACSCEKSDEERLREQIDTTKVHLYVAMKIAVSKRGDDPNVARIGERVAQAIGAYRQVAERRAIEGDDINLREVAGAGADLASLGYALYRMREEGQAIVRGESEDQLPAILPDLLRDLGVSRDVPILQRMDASTEHGLLMTTFMVLKLHPKIPVPVPPEIMLYEAWMNDTDAMGIPELAPIVRAAKSYLYATHDYCRLAQRESDGLDDVAGFQDELARAYGTMAGNESAIMNELELRALTAVLAALGHGSVAYCFMGRDEMDDARAEMKKFCDATDDAGIPEEDTAFIRAYLAYEDDDREAARGYLEKAKRAGFVDDDGRERLDALIDQLERSDGSLFGGVYDKAFFALWFAEFVFYQLEQAGIHGRLKETEVYAALADFAGTAAGVLGAAQDAVPNLDEVGEAAEGAWGRASKLVNKVRGRATEAVEGGEEAIEEAAVEAGEESEAVRRPAEDEVAQDDPS